MVTENLKKMFDDCCCILRQRLKQESCWNGPIDLQFEKTKLLNNNLQSLIRPRKNFHLRLSTFASLRKLREQRVLCFSIFYSQLHTLCSMVVVQFWQVITQHHWNLQLQSSYLVNVFVSYSRWQHMLSQFSGRSVGAVALQFLLVVPFKPR